MRVTCHVTSAWAYFFYLFFSANFANLPVLLILLIKMIKMKYNTSTTELAVLSEFGSESLKAKASHVFVMQSCSPPPALSARAQCICPRSQAPLALIGLGGEEQPTGLTKLTLVLLQLTHSQAAGPGPPLIINIHASYKINSQYHRRRGLSCLNTMPCYFLILRHLWWNGQNMTRIIFGMTMKGYPWFKKTCNHIKELYN